MSNCRPTNAQKHKCCLPAVAPSAVSRCGAAAAGHGALVRHSSSKGFGSCTRSCFCWYFLLHPLLLYPFSELFSTVVFEVLCSIVA